MRALLALAALGVGCAPEESHPPALEGTAIDLLSHPWTTVILPPPEGAAPPPAAETTAPPVTWEASYWRIPVPSPNLVDLQTLRFAYASAATLRLGCVAVGEREAIPGPFALDVTSPSGQDVVVDLGRRLMPTGPVAALTVHPPPGADPSDLTDVRLSTAGPARMSRVRLDGRTRRCLVVEPETGAAWTVRMPPGARLAFGYGVREEGWKRPGDGSLFQVEITEPGELPTLVWESYLTPRHAPPHRTWHHAWVDLSAYAGRTVTVRLLARASPRTGAPFASRYDPKGDAPVFSAPRIASRAEAATSAPNVILIVVDTLRQDGLGGQGPRGSTSPHLDRLLAQSVVFDRAYATAPWTHPSTGSLLTGLLPHQHGLGTSSRGPSFFRPGVQLITERFKSAGYATAVVSNNLIVSPDEGFGPGVDSFDTRCFEVDQYFGAERVTRYAIEWLDEEGDGPFFLYLHYFDPHDRYQAPLPDTRSFVSAGLQARVADADVIRGLVNPMRDRLYADGRRTAYRPPEDDLGYLRGLYHGEVRYADRWIGRLLAYLEEQDLVDSTLLVLTSDHGEEFFEHGYLKHGQGLHEELLHVPLIVRMPEDTRREARIRQPVSLTDVAPTLLAACGISSSIPEEGHGRPLTELLAPGSTKGSRPVFAVSYGGQAASSHPRFGPKRAVIEERWKLIHSLEPDRAELYDLREDPTEQTDLAARHPDEVARLKAVAEAVLEAPPEDPAAAGNPALLEKLRALGYVH